MLGQFRTQNGHSLQLSADESQRGARGGLKVDEKVQPESTPHRTAQAPSDGHRAEDGGGGKEDATEGEVARTRHGVKRGDALGCQAWAVWTKTAGVRGGQLRGQLTTGTEA